MITRFIALSIVAIAASCGRSSDPAAAAACSARTEQLHTWLSSLANDWPRVKIRDCSTRRCVDRMPALVERDGPTAKELPSVGVVIRGSTFQVMVCRQELKTCRIRNPAQGNEWSSSFEYEQADLPAAERGPNELVYLAVSPDTPWSNVVQAAEEIGRHRVALLFRKKRTSTEPSDFQPGIANAGYPERGRLILKQFTDCPAAGKLVLDSMGDTPIETVVSELPKAIRSCGCRADISRAESLLWERYGRDGAPTYSTLEFENVRDPSLTDPKPEIIQLPATLPWKSAFTKLSAHAGKRILLKVPDDPTEK